jgi:hypothetical protein
MSRTIKAIMAHMVPPEKREPSPVKDSKLVAQWQDGPETLSHHKGRKLRLVFARLPLDPREPA